jgi:hypothetical protein
VDEERIKVRIGSLLLIISKKVLPGSRVVSVISAAEVNK